jgi:hypothetical protein
MTDELTASALRTAWRAAEQSLYSLGGGDVDRYERAIKLVRGVVDALHDTDSTAALVDRWPAARQVVETAVRRTGVELASLPADQVAGAGFAMRHAALQAEEACRARAEIVAAARADDADWVVLHESGDLLAGLADPYGSTRMHLPSGLAIVAGVLPDPASGATVHTLTVVRLDPESGDLVDVDPGLADVAYFDCTSFRSGEIALRGIVEELASERRVG